MSPAHSTWRTIAAVALFILALAAWLTFVMTAFAQTPAPAPAKPAAAIVAGKAAATKFAVPEFKLVLEPRCPAKEDK